MLRQPAMTRCARSRPLLTLSGRRCMTASANNATVASPDVLTRMLNGGISLSAIFMAGQLSPQARLTATSMRRAVGSAASWVEAGDTLSVPAGQEERRKGFSTAAVCSRKARWLAKTPIPVRTFRHVAPQLSVCYATARSRGFWERAGVLPRKCRVPLNLKGFAPTVHGGADPLGIAGRDQRGRRTDNRLGHGGPLRDRLVRARARTERYRSRQG